LRYPGGKKSEKICEKMFFVASVGGDISVGREHYRGFQVTLNQCEAEIGPSDDTTGRYKVSVFFEMLRFRTVVYTKVLMALA
jgi:hypothetical protein